MSSLSGQALRHCCLQDPADEEQQRPRELRVSPFRTFFPGQTYEPSVRCSADEGAF